jgi:Protein of unknown function (DUF3014)
MPVDDLELDRDGVTPQPLTPAPARSWNPWLVGAAVVLAVAGGALARWWTLPSPPREAPATTGRPVASTDVPLDPAAHLPPLDQMDPYLRTLLGALSARPELAAWLATDDLIYQAAWTIDRVSRGNSPASELRVLAPKDEISTARAGRTRRLTEASYQRYDGLAETLASVDAGAVATAYRTIRPRLNEAYKSLGQTESSVDVAVQQALDLLIATPIPNGPIVLIEGKGATWAFADPALEALPAAQKHLLRMGPRNASKVVQALVQVRQRLQP